MDFLRSLIGWSSDEGPPAASPQVLPDPAPNLAKSKQPPAETAEKKKKTKQKKKKVEEANPKREEKMPHQVESKEETINVVPEMSFHDSGDGFTRVENKKKKRKTKNNAQRKGSNARNKNNRKSGKNGSNKHENNQKRKNGKKKKNGNKNTKPRTEFRPKAVLVRATPPIEPAWAEHIYRPPVERQEQAWLPPIQTFEHQWQYAERNEFARQMQPSLHIVKPRGGPATLIPTPNESEAPIESYASLSEGPTIEAPATPTLFIGFDPENEDDHALLDRHLRRSATHGDFIEVWSSVLNDWTVAQIYECRDGTLSARYVSSPAFKIVQRYDPMTWRPCRTNPKLLRKYDRSDIELKRLVKVFSEPHEKWMLGHVVGAVESLEEGPLVHVRLLQHLNQVVDISLFSPYLIPLPKGTSEELWRYIDAKEDRSPTPPEREVIHFRRTRRLKEILFCKGLEKLNSMVEPVFRNQKITTCIHSFGIDEKIEFDASFDNATALVASANHMQAMEFPGLTFTLIHLREDFLRELTKALDGQVAFRSMTIMGDKNHKMESFPLRVTGLISLEMHDVQLRDDEFQEFLTTATKGGQMRLLELYGMVDSTEKRDFVESLRDEFPHLDICLSKDGSEEILL